MVDKTKELVKLYFKEEKAAIKKILSPDSDVANYIARAADLVWDTYCNGGTVYACGNGGNTGSVSNLIADLSNHTFVTDDKTKPLSEDVPRLRCIDLCSSSSSITAALNDFGPETIFSQQLITNCVGKHDVIFGYSGSGSSANIVGAFETIKEKGGKTIAVSRNLDGKIVEMADVPIVFGFDKSSKFPGQQGSNDNNFYYEDFGFGLGHIITGIMRQRVTDKYNNDD